MMQKSLNDAREMLLRGWEILFRALRFYGANLPAILLIMSFAAVGRALQLGAAGPPGPLWSGILEVAVEGSRALFVVFLIGHGSVRQGYRNVLALFGKGRANWHGAANEGTSSRRVDWAGMVLSLLLFGLVAWGMNVMIASVASRPDLLAGLRRCGYMAEDANPYGVLLFMKNLTVIPLTLVFNYVLVMFAIGQMRRS